MPTVMKPSFALEKSPWLHLNLTLTSTQYINTVHCTSYFTRKMLGKPSEIELFGCILYIYKVHIFSTSI